MKPNDFPRHLRDLPAVLAAPRAAALWALGVTIPVVTLAALGLSYVGLATWAAHHGYTGARVFAFPLIIDVPVLAAEVVLFIAAIEAKTPLWVRAWAWSVATLFIAASVAANATQAAGDLATRLGWAAAPAALAIAFGFGLGELKRQSARYRQSSTGQRPGRQRGTDHSREGRSRPPLSLGVAGSAPRPPHGRSQLDRAAEQAAFDAYQAMAAAGPVLTLRDFAVLHCGGSMRQARRAKARALAAEPGGGAAHPAAAPPPATTDPADATLTTRHG